jgi:hypothetical protein
MTMPHLMNCPHSADGWCLDCVKELHDRFQARVNDFMTADSKAVAALQAENDSLREDVATMRVLLEQSLQGTRKSAQAIRLGQADNQPIDLNQLMVDAKRMEDALLLTYAAAGRVLQVIYNIDINQGEVQPPEPGGG